MFGRVVDSLLPKGYHHTTASILQPDTTVSGDIYELFGASDAELADIPLEFYTLNPTASMSISPIETSSKFA